jgi:uncharacterized cofD-like protein
MVMENKDTTKRIVCIGGGTGTFVVLRGLKYYPYHISAIVAMSDSGGSNKRIRDEFGLLPTSDIRQCFVALSDENGGAGLLRKLFMYRFEKGRGISGMTFGNLFMAALADILGSQKEAIRQTGKVLRIRGSVIPVSFTDTNLYAEYEDGHVLTEEHMIDEPHHDGRLRITKISLKPKAKANQEAVDAIQHADLVVLGPGDLYTSLVPNLLVDGIAEAVKKSHAKKVYIVNLMTKWGQTYNYSARDHVRIVESYIGQSINAVLINNGSIPQSVRDIYAKDHEYPVVDNLRDKNSYRIIRANIVSRRLSTKPKSDLLVRSLIRHDSDRLAYELVRFIDPRVPQRRRT